MGTERIWPPEHDRPDRPRRRRADREPSRAARTLGLILAGVLIVCASVLLVAGTGAVVLHWLGTSTPSAEVVEPEVSAVPGLPAAHAYSTCRTGTHWTSSSGVRTWAKGWRVRHVGTSYRVHRGTTYLYRHHEHRWSGVGSRHWQRTLCRIS